MSVMECDPNWPGFPAGIEDYVDPAERKAFDKGDWRKLKDMWGVSTVEVSRILQVAKSLNHCHLIMDYETWWHENPI